MAHPYLRWLKIHRYEGFEGVEIEFSPEENLILGVNGAGKTQLLRLLHSVLDFKFEALRAQAFDIEFEFVSDLPPRGAGGDGEEPASATVRGRVVNRPTSQESAFLFDSGITPPPQGDFKADLTIATPAANDAAITITIASGEMMIADSDDKVTLAFEWSTSILNQFANSRHPRALYTTPRWGSNRFREDADDFRCLNDEIEFAVDESGYIRVDFARWRAWLGIISRARSTLTLSREGGIVPADQRTSTDSIASFLGPLRATALFLEPERSRGDRALQWFKGIKVHLTFESGSTYRNEHLTFGQRRYLVIGLYALFYPYYVFLIDELDNGLHPRLVEALMLLLQGRQRFFASHNKLVIDYTAFESPDDVQKKVHIVRRDDEGRQHVEQISDAEAKEVFEKIDVGIMHPADVLEVEGLW